MKPKLIRVKAGDQHSASVNQFSERGGGGVFHRTATEPGYVVTAEYGDPLFVSDSDLAKARKARGR